MKIHENVQLHDLLDFYSQSIQYIIFHSMDECGKYDASHVKSRVSEMWLEDFVLNNRHLNTALRLEVINMFNRVMSDMDSSSYNKVCESGVTNF